MGKCDFFTISHTIMSIYCDRYESKTKKEALEKGVRLTYF